MNPALELRGVSKSFGTGPAAVHALRGIDLTVQTGELLAVKGRSGAGKTTMLHIIGGLEEAEAGTVLVDGVDVTALDEAGRLALRREKVAYSFQSFGLIPELTAAENVSLPLRLSRIEVKGRDQRVTEALEAVGLGPHAKQTPSQLSGGQLQRVSLARALVARPSLLLADEPTAQLDSETSLEIMKLITQLVTETGMTAIITTHDPVIVGFADYPVDLVDGAIRTGDVLRRT